MTEDDRFIFEGTSYNLALMGASAGRLVLDMKERIEELEQHLERTQARLAECRAFYDELRELRESYSQLKEERDRYFQNWNNSMKREEKLEEALDALVEERDQYDADLEWCRKKLGDLRKERDMLAQAMTDYRAEAEHQERERAAAEAIIAKLKEAQEQGVFAAGVWGDMDLLDNVLGKYWDTIDDSALTDALTQCVVEMLDFVEEFINGGFVDIATEEWATEDMIEAYHNVLDAHGYHIDRLRTKNAELREALKNLQHADGCYCDAAFAGPDGSHPSHAPECQRARELLGEE